MALHSSNPKIHSFLEGGGEIRSHSFLPPDVPITESLGGPLAKKDGEKNSYQLLGVRHLRSSY